MKSLVRQILAFLLILAIVPAGLCFFAFGLPTQFGETFLAELPDKCALLEKTEGRRIVVIGGSSVAFGLRCDLLEQVIPGYSAVNFGMYAGLGTAVMLDLALPYLRGGDLVIFSPEQSEQTLSTFLGSKYLWQAAEGDWGILSGIRGEDRLKLLGELPYFAAQKARFFLEGSTPAGDGVYAHSSFNGFGDIAYPERTHNIMTGGWDANMPISFDGRLLQENFLERFASFAETCSGRGVQVFYRFCPMNDSAVSEAEWANISSFEASLKEKLPCPLLGNAESAILPAGWFYDTNFHLNSAGAVANTARLAAELQNALGLPICPISVPQMPALGETDAYSGDDRDAPRFCYAAVDGGMMITGIAAPIDKLTVPTHYEGSPVISIAPDAFVGNADVEEIVIQQNITSIPDGVFSGCTGLKRIVMMSSAPAACSVGAGLLQGTDAVICVPAESYGAYMTNYFWSIHAARIQRGDAVQPGEPETLPAPGSHTVRYAGNGGVTRDGKTYLDQPVDETHLRLNTLQATRFFQRPGYLPLCWNTEPDGSGENIGFGSRVARRDSMTLYVQWVPETPADAFQTEIQGQKVWITGYTGKEVVCAVPETIGGLTVEGIRSGAFAGAELDVLVLPPRLRVLEDGAFTACTLREIYLFDTVLQIGDNVFTDCENLRTLHVNAADNPRFSTSYYAVFADKYDYLLSLAGQKKMVLFSGSSTRYAYDSTAIEKAYPDYAVVNMGVYAYTSALPQLELIRRHTGAGDVLLHAPEFDPLEMQFCCVTTLDHHFWAMMEANYDAVSELDLREYGNVFTSFRDYLSFRSGMPMLNYAASPSGYDDEGNRYGFATYNQNGDYILPRPNGEKDEMLNRSRADYTTAPFTPACIDSMNREYVRFLSEGVTVLFTYTPRNRTSLTEDSTPHARGQLDALLRSALKVPIISDLEGSLYPGYYFYLIDSHLSTEGVRLFTNKIIEDLRPWIS